MATRIKPTPAHLYERDFHAWAKGQADLLRAGRYADLDLEHLIEEVDDLGEVSEALGPKPHPHHHRALVETRALALEGAPRRLVRYHTRPAQ